MRRPNHPQDSALTPEESRWLDGTLDADARRRMERLLAADPARARRLARDREALDLWAADARRQAARAVGPVAPLPSPMHGPHATGLAEAVLQHVTAGGGRRMSQRSGEVLSPRAALAYAAAAMLLIGVGLGGTWLVHGQRAEAVPSSGHDAAAPDPDAPLLDGVSHAIKRGMVRRPAGDQPGGTHDEAGDDR